MQKFCNKRSSSSAFKLVANTNSIFAASRHRFFASSNNMSNKPESLVSCEQLKQVIDAKNPNVKVLDASWFMPAANRNPRNEFTEKRIPTSIFFDVDKQFASNDPALAHLPHMVLYHQAIVVYS